MRRVSYVAFTQIVVRQFASEWKLIAFKIHEVFWMRNLNGVRGVEAVKLT